jgi:hypothetical protein
MGLTSTALRRAGDCLWDGLKESARLTEEPQGPLYGAGMGRRLAGVSPPRTASNWSDAFILLIIDHRILSASMHPCGVLIPRVRRRRGKWRAAGSELFSGIPAAGSGSVFD